jgi:hypothetical protein
MDETETNRPLAEINYGEGRKLPVGIAARILAMLDDRNPALLSALIGEAYTGQPPSRKADRGQ